MLSASAAINIEPVTDICRMICCVNIGETATASSVKPPSIINTGRQESKTPKPNVDAKGIAEIQSITAFEYRVLLLPLIPLSIEPTMVMAPTQNKRVAETKPSAIFVLPFFLLTNFSSFTDLAPIPDILNIK